MRNEDFLKKAFYDKYGENLDTMETKMLNILLHLVCFENISIENIIFSEDKIVVTTERKINEEENVTGKYIIYNNFRYAYIEKNKYSNTISGIEFNRGLCGIYYKSIYDDFDIERTVGFKIRRSKTGVIFIENDNFNIPLYKCYPLAYEDFGYSKGISESIGQMIVNDVYNVIDFDIKSKKNLNKKR